MLFRSPADPNRVTATILSIDELPQEVPVILGEIVYLLGSALDQLIGVLMQRQGRSCSNTYFPIRRTEQELDRKSVV